MRPRWETPALSRYCPAALGASVERIEIPLILPLPGSHLWLPPFISDDAVVTKQLCYAPLVVPARTSVTSVALSLSKKVCAFVLFGLCLCRVLSACVTLAASHTPVLVCVYCRCVLAHKSSGHLVEDWGLDFGTPPKEEKKISWFHALFLLLLFCFSFFELSSVFSQCQVHQNGWDYTVLIY